MEETILYRHETSLRVRYAETDKMGYCYYGNYAQYFEVGRVEALRSLGYSYRALEDEGIGLPVKDFSINYKRPAKYDDELRIVTDIVSCVGARIAFRYHIYVDPNPDAICTAETTLVFVDMQTGRPVKAPADMVERLATAAT